MQRRRSVSPCCKTRQDVINCDAIESLCFEMTNEKSKNVILNLAYRLTKVGVKEFEKHLNKTLSTKQHFIEGGNNDRTKQKTTNFC